MSKNLLRLLFSAVFFCVGALVIFSRPVPTYSMGEQETKPQVNEKDRSNKNLNEIPHSFSTANSISIGSLQISKRQVGGKSNLSKDEVIGILEGFNRISRWQYNNTSFRADMPILTGCGTIIDGEPFVWQLFGRHRAEVTFANRITWYMVIQHPDEKDSIWQQYERTNFLGALISLGPLTE